MSTSTDSRIRSSAFSFAVIHDVGRERCSILDPSPHTDSQGGMHRRDWLAHATSASSASLLETRASNWGFASNHRRMRSKTFPLLVACADGSSKPHLIRLHLRLRFMRSRFSLAFAFVKKQGVVPLRRIVVDGTGSFSLSHDKHVWQFKARSHSAP